MTAVWVTIGVLALITFVFKATGPILVGGRELPPRAAAVIGLTAPAVLAALVVQETFAEDGALVVDARLAGMTAAVAALLAKLPMLAVVTIAAAVTAGVRAVA